MISLSKKLILMVTVSLFILSCSKEEKNKGCGPVHFSANIQFRKVSERGKDLNANGVLDADTIKSLVWVSSYQKNRSKIPDLPSPTKP